MNKKIIVILIALVITVFLSSCTNNTKQEPVAIRGKLQEIQESKTTEKIQENQPSDTPTNQEVIDMKKLTITSSVFSHNNKIPSKYTCDGPNVNPPLKIEGIPSEAKSLVLVMDDPDAIKPAGKVWDHWIVFNIPPKVTEINENEEPEGIHGKGTGGNLNYKGPCPPDAQHRYFFKVYALDTLLDLKEGATKLEVEKAMKDHIVAQEELVGLYG